MRRVIILGAVAAAGYWAYREGHLDPLLTDSGISRATSPEAMTPAVIGGQLGEGVEPSREQTILLSNLDVVSDWSLRNLSWTAAMMWAESRGNPSAESIAGALGAMQVMPGTAADLYEWGWRDFMPTRETLLSMRGSIYFGTAYLDYLSNLSRGGDRDWLTRAYNAGPDGQRADGTWPAETNAYVRAVRGQFLQLPDVEGMMI